MPDMTPAVPSLDYGSHPRTRSWSARRVLGWAFGIVVGLGLIGSILLPDLCRAREPANRAKCASNLHQIGLAILLYQEDNGGAYPDTLGRVYLNEQIGPEVFVCPSGNDERSAATQPSEVAADIDAGPAKHHCSYVYLGRGLTDKTVTATTVIAYDVLGDHDEDGGNVLYGDGHAEWQAKAWYAMNFPATTRPAEGRP
jgi:prepilin-type processing-associated H-X9-DG protein